MAKIAIAGATSQLAKEIIEKLALDNKHEVLGLARKIPEDLRQRWPSVRFAQTTYESKDELAGLLAGVDVVLCFFSPHLDPEGAAQIRLIDAAVQAGVKRFMPSEWFTGANLPKVIQAVPWFSSKLVVREYLKKINRDGRVFEYTLLSPGMFMDYLAYPHVTNTKHTPMSEAFVNFEDMRGFYIEGHEDDAFTVTAIDDIVNVVLLAIEYDGEWPVDGGVVGQTVSFGELFALGEKLRGKPLAIDRLKLEDVEAGVLKVTKLDPIVHPSMTQEQMEALAKGAFAGILRAVALGGMVIEAGGWNRLLPDYRFTTVEELLRKHF